MLHHGVSCSFCSAIQRWRRKIRTNRLQDQKEHFDYLEYYTQDTLGQYVVSHFQTSCINQIKIFVTGCLLRQFHRFETMFLNAMICRSTWLSHKETFTAFTTLTKQIYGDIDLIMTVAQSERARYNSLLWKSSFVAQYCRCNQHFLSFDKFTIESRNVSLPLPHLALFIHYCSRFAGSSSLLL